MSHVVLGNGLLRPRWWSLNDLGSVDRLLAVRADVTGPALHTGGVLATGVAVDLVALRAHFPGVGNTAEWALSHCQVKR